MSAHEHEGSEHEIAFETFGLTLAVAASGPDLLDRMRPYLPPDWKPAAKSDVRCRFSLVAQESGGYTIARDGNSLAGAEHLELDLAVELFDTQLRLYIGRFAPERIFVHAGVIAHQGKAVVIPGSSFSGKTSLVATLVRLGAVYYSDEFAVLDEGGSVHPYAKPLSIRVDNGGYAQTDRAVSDFGGVAGDEPLEVGAIVVTEYKRGAIWQPERLTAGCGAMALLSNAVPAQERPEQVMRFVSRAAEGALVLQGDRGEAEEMAPALLAAIERN